ncbi:hypothetical protein [Agarivorans sp. Z349TD_8]|uniref:hypothetical protein n=1 Tax=Agarivorans sp. Z349TD_8 TaxID=3421434 RepID=UPI003D7E7B7A
MVNRWDLPLSWGARFFGLFVSIFTIPYIIENVGVEGYSSIALIQALLPWLLLLDMGSGNYLKNILTIRRRSFLLKKIVVSVSFFLFILMLLFFLILCFSWGVVDKIYLSGDGGYVFFYPFLLLSLVALLELYTKFLYSFFKSSVANLTNILSLIVVFLLVTQSKSTNPADYLLMMLLPVLFSKLFLMFYFFVELDVGSSCFKLPVRRYVRLACLSLKKSNGFWILAIMGTFIVSTDVFIASQLLGAREIAVYLIVLRLYLTGYTVISSFIHIYWPKITIIITERQKGDFYRLISKVFVFFSIGIVGSTTLLDFSIFHFDDINIMQELKGSDIDITNLLFGFALLFIVRLWVDLFSTAMQSVGDTRLIIKLLPLQLVCSLVFQVLLAKLFGAVGLVLGLAFSYLLIMAYPLPREVYLKLTRV